MGEGFQGAEAYDYDSMGLQVDVATSSGSANYARGVDGYDPQVAPDPNWPGLAADPKQVRFDAIQVEGLLAQLEALIPTLQRQVTRLQGEVVQARFGHASWPQAENLRVANETVAKGVGGFTGNVVLNLESAVRAIKAALETYHRKEAEIQGGISRTSNNLNS